MTQEEWIRMQTAMKPVREKAKQQQPQKKKRPNGCHRSDLSVKNLSDLDFTTFPWLLLGDHFIKT